MENVTIPIGSIALIDKIEKDIGLISGIFGNVGGRSKKPSRNCEAVLFKQDRLYFFSKPVVANLSVVKTGAAWHKGRAFREITL